MNKILQEDIYSFTLPEELTDTLKDRSILVTGATGLIGSSIVMCINALNIGVKFILPVRNLEKAIRLFENIPDSNIILCSQEECLSKASEYRCDYIIHCASPTNGNYMSEHPVETFNFTVDYTDDLLKYCRNHPVKGMVYLSSIEYYGQIFNDEPVSEDMNGLIDHQSPRSSYSLGKQAAEFLVFAYAHEYGVPSKIARLTQTFGAGISAQDNRVFAQFARSIVKGENIVLHTPGKSAKPYCYLTDCVSAIIYILLKGKDGQAYNVATPSSYVTIRDLANLFCEFSEKENKVVFDFSSDHGYAPETRVNMDSSKLMELGWKPQYNLKEMIRRLLDYVRNQE